MSHVEAWRQRWADRLGGRRPDIPLIAPMFVYLLLLAGRDALPADWHWIANIVRGIGALLVVWLYRDRLPPWGRAHVPLAIPCAILIALGWYYGQLAFNALGVPQKIPLPFFSGEIEAVDPRTKLAEAGGFWISLWGVDAVFWLNAITRVAVATVTVAFVEELFWRGFLLRALIDWDAFERVPLGAFSWRSFLGTSLLSTLEHPFNWLVSIPCWFAFNGLMYWKKSLLFLVWVHGLTNLVLYAWVLYRGIALGDAQAWLLW